MQKVSGIGGVFIKSPDPKALAAWYDKHLGFSFGDQSYVNFKWVNESNPSVPGNTVFSFFKKDSKYFDPSTSQCMLNFRVDDLRAMIEQLKAGGVETVGDVMEESYGKFGWIVDLDGNKIELWEAVDAE